MLGGFTLAASYSYLPSYLSHKMSKQLNKLFDQEVLIRELSMNDTLALNHQLYEVYSADTLAGYSIITRALGCKIGGCDKPSKDSISFEQFYFFTAFDKDKNIYTKRISLSDTNISFGEQWGKYRSDDELPDFVELKMDKGLDEEIKTGEVVSIIGPSGGGSPYAAIGARGTGAWSCSSFPRASPATPPGSGGKGEEAGR